MKKIPDLWVVTKNRKIAHAQLQLVERSSGRRYLYLQWKDGSKPRRRYIGALA